MESQTVFITGASSGIGRATAELFLRQGWNVVATMREPQPLDGALVTRLDVTDRASVDDAVARAVEAFEAIDVLVNNAGYGAYGPLEAFDVERIERQFDTNVVGLLAVTKAVLPHMRARRRGVVVNLSSIGGRMTFPLGSLYHGSKFAVEGLSEALRYELEPLGIRVKLVEPGFVATDFGGRSLDFANDAALVEYQPTVDAVLKGIAATLGAAPAGVAEVILTAATDGSRRLRYPAGDDAREILAARAATDDEAFADGIKARFNLT
ncbi:SDR family oxidoreductase [Dactylosporangium sp. AC04546]|uniref:SDR family oxidoreductase n=1 Tax=Dactylosporangium sp. AC04546 TaxID=2862460 RepID=UPI001EDF04CD|nr:SDR family oxidoreductase [Dactylosporangium sp. AC04546]WVK88508.1 SDR family oxidoreductase [Dactylosporangium sp. AC04546]